MQINSKLGQKFFNIYRHVNKENRADDNVIISSLVDMSKVMAFRKNLKANKKKSPCITAIITKAIVNAVKIHPHVNCIRTGLFFKSKHQLDIVDFTFAVERNLKSGEMVTYAATIRNAGEKKISEIDQELRDLSSKQPERDPRWTLFFKLVKNIPFHLAKIILSSPHWSKKLWQQHRGGALFISSPCKYGGDSLLAAWPWPVCFSFGIVKDRAIVIDGKVEARASLNLIISFDRCFITGAPAARFFQEVINNIEDGSCCARSEFELNEESKILDLREFQSSEEHYQKLN